MSVDQYQRAVNSLDKDIAGLEKKKADADKKAAEEAKKAASITINKNASTSTIKNKIRQQEQHQNNSNKAAAESAELGKQISDKRSKRNDAYLKLQKEQQKEQAKNQARQEKLMKDMQSSYEQRISELTNSLESAIAATNPSNHISSEYEDEFDVFVSHAWEDKELFVDEFVDELRKHGLRVWYDTSEIKWGDSMRKRIDDGLKKSRYGVVVLSPNYIADGKYWTKAELDGLFQIESGNSKTILPIWHNLTKKEVMDYSPIVASRKAMTTAMMTAEEIANELAALFSSVSNRE